MVDEKTLLSDEALFRHFVTPNVYIYFRLKCPDIEEAILKERMTELLKFMILSSRFPGGILFTPEIDDVWHLWIMQTQQYERLCRMIPPGRFIHHDSNDHPREHVSWEEAEDLLRAMKASKELHEGRAPPPAAGTPEFDQSMQRMLSFFASYIQTFGPLEARHVKHWPPIGKTLRRMGWTIDDFNAFLMAQGAAARGVAEGREHLHA